MRELTEAEYQVMDAKRNQTIDGRDNPFTAFRIGFTAGLEAQDARIAEIKARIAELESDIKIAEMYKRYSEIEI
jgi:hypothetical protein